MTVEKALQRIMWRFSEPKQFTPNLQDVEAIEAIKTAFDDMKKGLYDSNQGFAKLFIFTYAYFIKHYKADLFDEIPQKEISRMLEKPISVLIQRFTDNLNDSNQYFNLESLIGELKHPASETEKEREEKLRKIREEVKKNPAILDKITCKAWETQDVEEGIMQMVGTALMRFK